MCPCLLLAATFMYWICRRMTVEVVGMYLQNGQSVATMNVVDNSLASFHNINSIDAIDQKTRHSVVLAGKVHITVACNIVRESVDSMTVVYHDNQEMAGCRWQPHCEQLGHASILRTSISYHNQGHTVIFLGKRWIILLDNVVIFGDMIFDLAECSWWHQAPQAYGRCSDTSAHPP